MAHKTATVRNTLVTIFCDPQKALNAIALPSTCQEYRFLRSLKYQKAEELQSNGHHTRFSKSQVTPGF